MRRSDRTCRIVPLLVQPQKTAKAQTEMQRTVIGWVPSFPMGLYLDEEAFRQMSSPPLISFEATYREQ
jgi:hypothetical protein